MTEISTVNAGRHSVKDQGFSVWIPWLIPILGFSLGLWVLGWDVVNPCNTRWLKMDLSQVYLGWAFFRLDPHWHFPLSFTDQVSWPAGCCISNTNSVPLVAVLCKLFSGCLPATFQWLGLLGLLNSTLQAVFGYALCRRFTPSRAVALVGCLFFLLTPAFTYRMATDMVLSSQWLILFSLWIYFREPAVSSWRAAGWHSLVLFLAGGIHPYLAIMCALIVLAEMLRALRHGRRWNLKPAAGWLAPLLALLVSWLLFGYLQSGDRAPKSGLGGYGDFSFNLLSLIDPNPHLKPDLDVHSIFLPDQTGLPLQVGCFNYLGLGTLLLFLVAGLSWRKKLPAAPAFLPLWLVALGCFCLAVSNKVTWGGMVLFEMPLPFHPFGAMLSIFRGSDRLFWPAYYILLIFVLRTVFQRFSTRQVLGLLAALAALQLADTQPLRAGMSQAFARPRADATLLGDPFWHAAGGKFHHLVVLPAWQSRPNDSALPGGPDQWQRFGFAAAAAGMTLNANYLARPIPLDERMQSEILPAQVMAGRLEPDTLYVLDAGYLLEFIARKFSGIESAYVDHQLVFWRGQNANPTNLTALGQRLEQVLAEGVDLKQVARGFVIPPTVAIPYDPSHGFKLAAGQTIRSQGSQSSVPIFTAPNRSLKKIILSVTPLVGGPVTEQRFTVSLNGFRLGDYALRQAGQLTINLPAGRLTRPDAGPFQLLQFDWQNPTSPEVVNPPPTGRWTTYYRRLLSALHVKNPPESRRYAVDFSAMTLVTQDD